MGLLGKLFGGGTDLSLELRSTSVIAGGVVAGTVKVTGGKKPLTITAVVVTTYYVHVKSGDGPLPEIDLRKLSEATVAANTPLPAGQPVSFDFTVQLPEGLDPAGSYKVIATADIPSVKDPKADADFKVIAPGQKRGGILGAVLGASEGDILGRFPGLLGDEDEQFTGLLELRSEAYGEDGKKLVAIAPWLLRFAKTGPEDLRDEALETWATILDNRARPADLKELEAFARDSSLSRDLREAVVASAAKFAEEGAWELFASFARDAEPEIRSKVAYCIAWETDRELAGRLPLLLSLVNDSDVAVRRDAARALSSFSEDQNAMRVAAEIASGDPSAEVRAAAIESISGAHYNGMLEMVLGVYGQHLGSPHVEVRTAIAGRLGMLPADNRVAQMVHTLLGDNHRDVRKAMAWQAVNMSELPQLAPAFRQVAEQDQDHEVRAEAVGAVARGFLTPPEGVKYILSRLAADPSERLAYEAVNVARNLDEEPSSKQILEAVARSQYADAASYARRTLQDLSA